MAVGSCAGTGCSRSISISIHPRGNPVALRDPEGWAVDYMECSICHKKYCDRCAEKMEGQGRPATCRCGGPLVWRRVDRSRPFIKDWRSCVSREVAKTIREINGCAIVPCGEKPLAEDVVKELGHALLTLVYHNKHTLIVVDLSKTRFISSAFLGALCRAWGECLPGGTDIVLAGPNKQILSVLEITRLAKSFEIFDSVDAAVGRRT